MTVMEEGCREVMAMGLGEGWAVVKRESVMVAAMTGVDEGGAVMGVGEGEAVGVTRDGGVMNGVGWALVMVVGGGGAVMVAGGQKMTAAEGIWVAAMM